MDLYYENKPSDALILLDSFIDKYPNEYDLYKLKHELLSFCHRHNEALKAIDKALSIKETPAALNSKAITLSTHQIGRLEESICYFDKALEGESDLLHIHNIYTDKGEILRMLNRKQESYDCYNKALEILEKMEKNNHKFYFSSNKITCLTYLDRIDESLELCNKEISDAPENIFSYFPKIETLIYQEKYKEALDLCNKTLSFEVDSEDDFTYIYLYKSRIHAIVGDKKESLTSFKKALSLDFTLLDEYPRLPKELIEIKSMYDRSSTKHQ